MCYVSWCRNLCACVKLKCITSDYFSILSGAPQGSLFSGKLFNLVIYQFLIESEEEHLGRHIIGVCAGAITNADNILLLTASDLQMHRMLELCYKFGLYCDLIFNFTKSI